MNHPTLPPAESLTEKILDLLPQTQCTNCGYASCRSYAEAIANQEADINHCATGGQQGISRLAKLLNVEELPLNTTYGNESPRSTAIINEEACIGCTICIRMCPTDAIIGARGMMHNIAENFCTGCGICVPRCPLDAISLQNVSGDRTGWDAWSVEQATEARQRHERKLARLLGNTDSTSSASTEDNISSEQSDKKKADIVSKAIARARMRLAKYGIPDRDPRTAEK